MCTVEWFFSNTFICITTHIGQKFPALLQAYWDLFLFDPLFLRLLLWLYHHKHHILVCLCLNFICMKWYSYVLGVSGVFHSLLCLWDLSMLLLCYLIPLYEYTTVYLIFYSWWTFEMFSGLPLLQSA